MEIEKVLRHDLGPTGERTSMCDAPKKIPLTLINCETMRTIRALLIDAEQRASPRSRSSSPATTR